MIFYGYDHSKVELYALVHDRDTRITELEAEVESEGAVLAMTVSRLGGKVEGRPTLRLNFLQRIDELRQLEAQLAALPMCEEIDKLLLELVTDKLVPEWNNAIMSARQEITNLFDHKEPTP